MNTTLEIIPKVGGFVESLTIASMLGDFFFGEVI
jgi:hypothetical protein